MIDLNDVMAFTTTHRTVKNPDSKHLRYTITQDIFIGEDHHEIVGYGKTKAEALISLPNKLIRLLNKLNKGE